MRIISGYAGGLHLKSVPGNDVRPTGDRVKESIFSTLGDFQNAVVFDLFAGSGALGLEALSRGAAKVVFFEINRHHMDIIKTNLENVRKALPVNSTPMVDTVCGNALNVAMRYKADAAQIDIVFADPPYRPGRHEIGAADLIKNQAFREWAHNAILVLEHSKEIPVSFNEWGWSLLKQKKFGDTMVSFARN